MDSFRQYQQDRWNRRQVASSVAAVVLACLCCVLFLASGSGGPDAEGAIVLNEKINPNTADVDSLMRLANIGPKRAEAIVAYRSNVPQGDRAFEGPQDMEKIKGIGPATVEAMKSELCFD